MSNELRMALLLDQLVDDLNLGEMSRVYDLIASDDEDVAELLPLLDLAAWFTVSSTQMPVDKKEAIQSQIRNRAGEIRFETTWTMQRLVKESDAQAVAQGVVLGLAPAELDAVSSDTTPFSLEEPNEAVAELARRYHVQFYGLMRWVRQLISSILNSKPSSSMTMLYARDSSRKEDDQTE